MHAYTGTIGLQAGEQVSVFFERERATPEDVALVVTHLFGSLLNLRNNIF